MNYEQRLSDTVGPWWKAVAEEPAHNRSPTEWGNVAMRPLKAGMVVMGLLLAFGFAFHSDFALVVAADGTELYSLIQGGLGAVLWALSISGAVLAAKAGVSEYRKENYN